MCRPHRCSGTVPRPHRPLAHSPVHRFASLTMRVQIENCMRYSDEKPAGFSPHRIRLYPRTDQSIVTHRLETLTNITADIHYRRDLFDNLVANCFFPQPAAALEIRSRLEVELRPKNPFPF